ncbi:hypothetical protein [Sulfobacillus thermotolerans]|uniref:ParM/StbA family protein n=1 Tax=Sulfobacillus thermotolerans TaxID=338644 RepID=UPI0033692F23
MMSENRVAVDCGHGCVKALTDHGQRLLGPSLIVPVVEGAETWGTLDAVKPDVVQWAGHEANHYLVGQDAAPHAASLFSRDKAADVLTRDLTMIAVGRLLATSGRVRLAVGVPLAWYLQARREIPEAWAGIVTVNGQTLTIAQVAVWPQGVAALLAVLPPTASQLMRKDTCWRCLNRGTTRAARQRRHAPMHELGHALGNRISHRSILAWIICASCVHSRRHFSALAPSFPKFGRSSCRSA